MDEEPDPKSQGHQYKKIEAIWALEMANEYYLCEGIDGYRWTVPKHVFERIYAMVDHAQV